MFTQSALKVASIIAVCMAGFGLFMFGIAGLVLPHNGSGLAIFIGLISWGILLWASIIGLQLSSYKLYEDEYRKVCLRVYGIIAAFLVLLLFGRTVGLVLPILLLKTLWSLKTNYDEWDGSESSTVSETSSPEEQTK